MSKKIIISGGGTGGHIFPAIAIANALKQLEKDIDILFVGAQGRMEMEKIPAAGYRIIGLSVAGLQRRLSWQNLLFPFRVLHSLQQASQIIEAYQPDAVAGVGGYASWPVLEMAARKKIPVVIQEQNSYAGLANRLLGKKASKIFVAYDGMEKYFPKEKIIKTGNPVRQDLVNLQEKKNEAMKYFNLTAGEKVILVIGGSLGARTINQAIAGGVHRIIEAGYQLIWQCGKIYYEEIKKNLSADMLSQVHLYDFISRMDLAYAAADVIVSRAGAGSIAELCMAGKPAILIPSPNVAEDHQTRNAMALADKQAAVVIKDEEAIEKLPSALLQLLDDKEQCAQLSTAIASMAVKDASLRIAKEILCLIDENRDKKRK